MYTLMVVRKVVIHFSVHCNDFGGGEDTYSCTLYTLIVLMVVFHFSVHFNDLKVMMVVVIQCRIHFNSFRGGGDSL